MRFAKPQVAIKGTGERSLTGNWLYASGLGYITIPDAETVLPTCVCPCCGEDRVDWLVWQESTEGQYVECASCGAWYDPNEED